jgi:2-amino-4-deoxychorismate synthase
VDALLERIVAGTVTNFALLHRPHGADGGETVDVMAGDVHAVATLAELPEAPLEPEADRHDVLAVVPFRQLVERGFDCHDDGTPLLAMTPREQRRARLRDVLDAIPDRQLALVDAAFDLGDEEYGDMVRAVVAGEIGRGNGANFVLRRTLRATVPDFSTGAALAAFRRLLLLERGAYWTLLVRFGDRTLLGATPERHVSVDAGVVAMTPISGTYRYPAGGPTVDDVLGFLADRKEADELHMVLDEELKMMSRICADGCRLAGPFVRPMARLAHTEYTIHGRTTLDVRHVLRETMFAPTVTGSPLESACRVIARHERRGRGFYGGAFALIGQRHGQRRLDSAIAIRTAHVDAAGRLEIGVGATLVRHCDPAAEAAETRAKAAALVNVFTGRRPRAPSPRALAVFADPLVGGALGARNGGLSPFWRGTARVRPTETLRGLRIELIDADDAFADMLAHQIRALGPVVTVRPYGAARLPDADIAVLGPGPGDPRDGADAKIAALRGVAGRLLADRTPVLAVCLGHQVVCTLLRLRLRRKAAPAQGAQLDVVVFGRRERVGFYNTFSAVSAGDAVICPVTGSTIEVSRDRVTGEVHALRGPGLRSVQFHPESVLTRRGPGMLRELLTGLAREGDRIH